MEEDTHVPVMVNEVLRWSDLPRGGLTVLDATFGRGGHTRRLLAELDVRVMLLMDRDPLAVAAAEELRAELAGKTDVRVRRDTFDRSGAFLRAEGLAAADVILMDLGVSTPQLEDPQRGFSFHKPGPLDMRMDPGEDQSAADLIARLPEQELADLIYHYGEEHASRRIARAIVEARGRGRLRGSGELAAVIERVLPRRGKLHPATRTFQALRIAVNRELEILEAALKELPDLMAPGGRFIAIAFHSLEDRLVKNALRDWRQRELGEILTPKCVRPGREEVLANRRARSARLRCFARAA